MAQQPVKIRLTGTPDALDEAIARLKESFFVAEVSDYYSNRGLNEYRCYVFAKMTMPEIDDE